MHLKQCSGSHQILCVVLKYCMLLFSAQHNVTCAPFHNRPTGRGSSKKVMPQTALICLHLFVLIHRFCVRSERCTNLQQNGKKNLSFAVSVEGPYGVEVVVFCRGLICLPTSSASKLDLSNWHGGLALLRPLAVPRRDFRLLYADHCFNKGPT